MKIYLDDVENGYYPTRFELITESTNNNHGIIFNSAFQFWLGYWMGYCNTHMTDNDYTGYPDWTDVNRFQLYWSGEGKLGSYRN